MGKRKGKSVKKAREGQIQQEEEFKKAPHSFVFHRGRVGRNVAELITDMRRVLAPYSASGLKVKKKNVLKDFVSIAGPLNVSHFLIFTKTEMTSNLRILRLPRGPTLTFQIKAYSLSRDIVSSLKRHNMEPKQFLHHPLLVMNNFSGEGMHMKLMATMFQNMFPSINVNKVKLGAIRRCVLLHYNQDEKTVEFRHYNIRAVPVGISRGVKKIVKAKIPNLSRFNDISEYLIRGGDLSESEAELDGPHNEVVLPQDIHTRGNMKAQKSAIRMTEIGPRLTLQLVKIEEGVCQGEVLFHEFVSKTSEELADMESRRAKKKQAKEARKIRQEDNVKRKKEEKELQKKRSLSGMKKVDEEEDVVEGVSSEPEEVVDDDAEYYRQEVGEEPDPDLLLRSSQKYTGKKQYGMKRRLPFKGKDSRTLKKARFSKESEKQQKFSNKQGQFKSHGEQRKHSNDDFRDRKNKASKFGAKSFKRDPKAINKNKGPKGKQQKTRKKFGGKKK